MAWVVKQGRNIHHSGKQYAGGDSVPCTDEEAASLADYLAPMVMKADAPQAPVTATVENKKRK